MYYYRNNELPRSNKVNPSQTTIYPQFPIKKQDILLCQVTKIEENCFSQCEKFNNNYTIFKNNSRNEFGTSTIVKNDIQPMNFKFDTDGRVIMLNTESITIVNIYPKAGTDSDSRKERELFTNTLPKMIQYIKQNIIMGGD